MDNQSVQKSKIATGKINTQHQKSAFQKNPRAVQNSFEGQKLLNNPQRMDLDLDLDDRMQSFSFTNQQSPYTTRNSNEGNRYQKQRRKTEWEQFPDQFDTRSLRSVQPFKQEQFSEDNRSEAYSVLFKKYKVKDKEIGQLVKCLQTGGKAAVVQQIKPKYQKEFLNQLEEIENRFKQGGNLESKITELLQEFQLQNDQIGQAIQLVKKEQFDQIKKFLRPKEHSAFESKLKLILEEFRSQTKTIEEEYSQVLMEFGIEEEEIPQFIHRLKSHTAEKMIEQNLRPKEIPIFQKRIQEINKKYPQIVPPKGSKKDAYAEALRSFKIPQEQIQIYVNYLQQGNVQKVLNQAVRPKEKAQLAQKLKTIQAIFGVQDPNLIDIRQQYKKILLKYNVPQDQLENWVQKLVEGKKQEVLNQAVRPKQKQKIKTEIIELQKRSPKKVDLGQDKIYQSILKEFGVPQAQILEYIQDLKNGKLEQVAQNSVRPAYKDKLLGALQKVKPTVKKPNLFKQKIEQLLRRFAIEEGEIESSTKQIIEDQLEQQVAKKFLRPKQKKPFCDQVKILRQKFPSEEKSNSLILNKLSQQLKQLLKAYKVKSQEVQTSLLQLELGKVKEFMDQNLLQNQCEPFLAKLNKILPTIWLKNWESYEKQLQSILKSENVEKTQIKQFLNRLKTNSNETTIDSLNRQNLRQKISHTIENLQQKHKINHLNKLKSYLISIFSQEGVQLEQCFTAIVLFQPQQIANNQQILKNIRKANQEGFKTKILNSCKIKDQEQISPQKMNPVNLFNDILASLLKCKESNRSLIFEIVDNMFDQTTEKLVQQVSKLPKKLVEKLLFWKKQILPQAKLLQIKLSEKIELGQKEKQIITQIIQIRMKILKQLAISNQRKTIQQTLRQQKLENTNIKQKLKLLMQEKQNKQLTRMQLKTLDQQISEFEKIIKIIDKSQAMLAKLENQFEDMTDFLIQHMQLENRQKITERQAFQAFIKLQKEEFQSHLKKDRLEDYFKGKKTVLNLLLLQIYKENNLQQVSKYCRRMSFKNQTKIVFIQANKPLNQIIKKNFKIPSQEIIVLSIKDGKQISVFDLEKCQTDNFLKQSQGCSLEIRIAQSMVMQINNQFNKILVSKQLSLKMIKQICRKKLQSMQMNFDNESFDVKGISTNNQLYDLDDTIEKIELIKKINIKALEIIYNAEILVYYDSYFKKKVLSSKQTVEQLKVEIQKDIGIPVSSQIILGIIEGNQNQEQFHSEQLLSSLVKRSNKIQVSLMTRVSLVHYGFSQRTQLKNQHFVSFFVQKTENKKAMIQNFKFRSSDQKDSQSRFLSNILPYLYSGLKKRFLFEAITQGFQQGISQLMSQDIWMQQGGESSTFNSNFISVYLLSNSDQQLRITLMNIMKQLYPIPMYFRDYQTINKVKNQWTLNQQLVWILHPSINICSVGIHNQKEQQNGKSDFLNKIFFTCFTHRNLKHPIAQGSPEIALDIYGKYHQLNLIDIPRLCPPQIEENMIEKSNILLVHSWKSKEQTQKYIAQIRRKFPDVFVICFMRDSEDPKGKINKQIKESGFTSGIIIPIFNLSKANQTYNIFCQIRDKINNVIKSFSKAQILQKKKLFQLFQNKLFNSFQQHLGKMQNKMHQLKVVGKFNDSFNQLSKKPQTEDVKREIQQLRSQIKNLNLHPILYDIYKFISENNQKADILFQRFKQVIKKFKEQAQKPYTYLYQSKKIIENLSQKEPSQFKQEINKINEKLNSIKNINIDIKGKTKDQVLNAIMQKGIQLESQIRPLIFSIQLAWRQLVYLSIHRPEINIGNMPVQRFLVDSRKREARMSQPFEVIDGDSLEMPKKMLKQMFGGFNKRVVIISILGPQSSGKSTLLNFLFGCDFSVSQGRCTRGVYGSYFDLSNMKYLGVDGIFILDTEGLFAIVNKKDEKNRRDFDSKLVLFCLTVSDIVIINTKGNIDNETSRKLKTAMDKFDNVCQQGVEKPKFFLVLNQGNSGSTQTSEADINKLSQIFPMKNSHSLGQAYDIKQIGKDQISLLEKNQRIIKKEAKKQFLQSVFDMLDNIVNQIQGKGSFKYILQAIDRMQCVWVTIEKFPNLANSSSKKVKQLEEKLTAWKSENLHQNLNHLCKQLTQRYQAQQYNRNKCDNQMSLVCQKIIQDFEQKFKKEDQGISQEQLNRINIEQKNIQLYIASSKNQLLSNISDIQEMNKVKLAKLQGNLDISQAIRQIKIKQNQKKIQIPEQEKIQIFQEAYKNLIQKTQRTIDIKNQINQSFDRIKQNYSIAMSTSSADTKRNREVGLLRQSWPLQYNKGYQDYVRQLIRKNQHQLIQYSRKSHTNTITGGRTDASLKYFNMNQYFAKKTKKNYTIIKKSDILSYINHIKLSKDIFQRIKQKKIDNKLLENLFNGINSKLLKVGFKMTNQKKFEQIIKKKLSSRFLNFLRQIYQDIIIDVQVIKQASHLNLAQNQNSFDYLITLDKLKHMKQERKQYTNNTQCKEPQTYINGIARQITKNSIKWDKILQLIQSKQKIDKQTIKKQNNAIKQCLSQDLKCLDIEINSEDFFQQVISNKNANTICNNARVLIKQRSSQCVYVDKKQMQDKIKRLQYFNGSELLHYKRLVYQIDDSMICLYCQDKQIFEPIEKFQNASFLRKYLSDSTNEITEVLNNHNIRSFLLQELKQKDKINLLFQSIKQIVQKLALSLDKQTIQAIYSEVNRQIAAFNNDINQVSCQISLILNGYCHLYAIYCTWKKLALETERIKRAPLNQLIKDKQRQKQHFLNMTSGNQQRICETECDKIMDQALVHIKKVVQDYKTPHIENAIKRYKDQNTRQSIQKKIDIQTFRQGTPFEQILKYLQDPKSVIEKKYQSQINNSLDWLDAEFKMNSLVKEIYTQISQCIEQMQTLLCSKEYSIKKQQASFSDFFSIITHGKQQIRLGDPIFQEKAKRVFLKYILDLFIKGNQQKYIQDLFIAQPDKKPIVFNRVPKPCFQTLIGILKKTDTGITNLVIFVEKIKQKLYSMREKIYQTTQLSQEDKQTFRQGVRVNVCHEKCPGCQRLCGEQGSHPYHKCKYGHQMRALGNVMLQNGEASVIRCQDLQPFNVINFNGKDMSWTQFKAYFETHQNNKWKFDDMVRGNRQELFDLAWNIVGKEYCTKKSMKWVASNQITTQGQKKTCFSKTHYIFALDQSGSMGGKSWQDAISALIEAVNSIKKLNREQALRISIIKFASTSTIFQQNKKPSQVSFNIPFGGGGTQFSAPFKHAISIANKCIQEFKIVFMFMSDGCGNYPKQQIKTIQAMQLANPGRFQFNGLQFGSTNSSIKQMADDLKGTTSGAIHGGQHLAAVYKEIITRDTKLN